MVAKEIENNRDLGFVLIGFIDDNARKHKRKIMGYPVFGGKEELVKLIHKKNIQEIIVSFKHNNEEKRKEVKNLCRSMDAEVEVTQMRLVIS